MKCAMLSCSAHSADKLTFRAIQARQFARLDKPFSKMTAVGNLFSFMRIPRRCHYSDKSALYADWFSKIDGNRVPGVGLISIKRFIDFNRIRKTVHEA